MKKVLLTVIILICLIPVLTQAKEDKKQEEVLLSVLDTIGGEFIEGDVSVNGLLTNSFLNVEELDNLGKEIIESIGLIGIEMEINTDIIDNEYYIKEEINDEDYKQVNYFGYDKDNNPLTVILSTYINSDNTKGETYLYINLIKKEYFLEINDIIVKIDNIFTEYNTHPEVTTCLIGGFDGKLNEKELEKKGTNAIHKVNGKIVDVYKDEEMISYTAYTDNIENNIFAGEDRINLNVALRYNEYDDQTLIWIGTPIITSGY